ncbi:MAG: response regulator [Bacteroidales bacterium]
MMEENSNLSKIKELNILVVEDDTVSRIFLRELLASTQAVVNYARSGYETFQHLEKNALPHVIILDLKLPDVDGVELARVLRGKYPGITIIAQTAYVSVGMEERCRKAGVRAFIAKPVKKGELVNLLSQLAEEHTK